MEKRKKAFEAFNLLRYGVMVIVGKKIFYANKAAAEMIGSQVNRLNGQPLETIFPGSNCDIVKEALARIVEQPTGSVQTDIVCRRQDGKDIHCVLLINVGGPEEIVVSLFDSESGIAAQDHLTGLFNRRTFFVLAKHEIEVARRTGQDVYVFAIDVDDLKIANDTLGHQIGDEMLQATAAILRQGFRKSDIIARFGGDEFSVLAVTEVGIGDHLIDRLKVVIGRKSQEFEKKYGRAISLSVGMVLCDPEEDSVSVNEMLESALAEADALMYEEKKRKKINAR